MGGLRRACLRGEVLLVEAHDPAEVYSYDGCGRNDVGEGVASDRSFVGVGDVFGL